MVLYNYKLANENINGYKFESGLRNVHICSLLGTAKSINVGDKESDAKCFLSNVRDKGTDLPNNVITRTKTIDAGGCQRRCQQREQCNFFLFFSATHSQWYKRRECRLLKQRGPLEVNVEGHISGPKNCKALSDGKNNEDTEPLINIDFQSDTFIESAYDDFIRPNNILLSKTCLEDYRSLNGKYSLS